MVTKRVIPCLDVAEGRVVKGVRFTSLRDCGDPAALAEEYMNSGADELVMLDVSATDEGRATALETVAAIRERLAIPLTVGGGVRSVSDAERLLEAGADKVSVNSAAVADPAILTEIADRLGRQCAVVAIDARKCHDGWTVLVRSGKDDARRDAVAFAVQAVEAGAGEVLLTSWDRDGTGEGYDLDLLRAVSRAVHVPVIASGGAKDARHMAEAFLAGADAVLAASIFHDREARVWDIKDELAGFGVTVRL